MQVCLASMPLRHTGFMYYRMAGCRIAHVAVWPCRAFLQGTLILTPNLHVHTRQVLWDVATGNAICGSPTHTDFTTCVKFLNNRSDKLMTAGNYNLHMCAHTHTHAHALTGTRTCARMHAHAHTQGRAWAARGQQGRVSCLVQTQHTSSTCTLHAAWRELHAAPARQCND